MEDVIDEGPAPWTIAQKISLMMFPIFLISGVVAFVVALSAPPPPTGVHREATLPFLAERAASGSLPAAMVIGTIVLFGGLAFGAIVIAGRRSECPDERDQVIEFQALRRFFWVTTLGVFLPLAIGGAVFPPGFQNVGLFAFGLLALAQAVYYGSILQLYHSANKG